MIPPFFMWLFFLPHYKTLNYRLKFSRSLLSVNKQKTLSVFAENQNSVTFKSRIIITIFMIHSSYDMLHSCSTNISEKFHTGLQLFIRNFNKSGRFFGFLCFKTVLVILLNYLKEKKYYYILTFFFVKIQFFTKKFTSLKNILVLSIVNTYLLLSLKFIIT